MQRTGWLAVGALAGALFGAGIPAPPAVLLALALAGGAATVGCVTTARPRAAYLAAGAALIVARLALGVLLAPSADAKPPGAAEDAQQHSGVVSSVGTPDGGLQRAIVELRPSEPAERIYAWLPRYPQIAPADIIVFDGRLEAPPEEGDFADYLARSSISATVRAHTLARLGTDGSPLAALEGIRRGASDLLTRVLPEPQAGLATAMAIGLRDVVGREVSDDFRTAGLSHVVAISGWHIAMLGGVVAALLGGLGRRRRSLLVLLAIGSYALLAGASPSILRAAVMASVVIVSREMGRRGQAAAALALTCAALLLLDPGSIFDIGFQLSAAATAGLLAWASRLKGWIEVRVPSATPSWLVEALAVSTAAQAATLPLVLLQFGRLSLVSPLANLLIAPLVAPVMLLTAICLGAGAIVSLGVPVVLLAPISLIGSLGVGAMISIAHFCATLPFASVTLPEPFNLVAALASGALIALVVSRRPATASANPAERPRSGGGHAWSAARMSFAGGAFGLSLMLAFVAGARPDGRLNVTVLDVGQGDAILLQGPQGGRMLIDTGPDPDRLLRLLDARVPPWDRRIDLVVLSHPHEDHVGGLWLLLRRYRVGAVVEPGMLGPGPGDAAYRAELAAQGSSTRIVAAGDRLWLDGIPLDVDWPLPGKVSREPGADGKSINNVSIVLELHFGARRMLFTGDAEEEVDPQLLGRGLADHLGGRLDVLKVAHHGSGTATTNALLDALLPRVAVISVGWGNSYGHPAPATIDRLIAHGAQVYRTDMDGSVAISTDGSDLRVTSDGGRPQPSYPPRQTPSGATDMPAGSRTPIGRAARRTYNRPDVRPHPRPGRGNRSRPRAAREAGSPLGGRRRDRGLSGLGHGPPRRGDRSDPRRDRGAPA